MIPGRSLPETFYLKYKSEPDTEFFYTKRENRWKSVTYRQAFEFIRASMGGLKRSGFGKGKAAAILSENREEWALTDYAIQWLGGFTVAIYTTASSEQMRQILEEAEVEVLFVSNEKLLNKVAQLTDFLKIKNIIVWEDTFVHVPTRAKVIFRKEFLNEIVSEQECQALLEMIAPDDTCALLYTSGTTGEPKGVMITHQNLLANIRGILSDLPEVTKGKVSLSFLPLSHIYERCVHHLMILAGLRVYFAESLDGLVDNVKEVRPQVMTAVPRIFEKIYLKIMERIKNAPKIRKRLFYAAIAIGKRNLEYRLCGTAVPLGWRLLNGIADVLVFRQIRSIVGGRPEAFISGAAPLSHEIAEFFCLSGVTILEGYGLSETCILSCNRSTSFKFGTVGKPFPGIKFKISDDGEIYVKGPTIMKGYFKRPDETQDAFTDDGWYKTGDIGELDVEGFLQITDRKKDLIVTAGGKKVAPQPIENHIKADPLVENVCLIGDTKKYIVALIVPNLELCQSWATHHNLQFQTFEDCAKSEHLAKHYRTLLEKINKDLPRYSTVKDFRILPNPFSIEGGELTPTLKLKRRVVQDKYQDLIAGMYPEDFAGAEIVESRRSTV